MIVNVNVAQSCLSGPTPQARFGRDWPRFTMTIRRQTTICPSCESPIIYIYNNIYKYINIWLLYIIYITGTLASSAVIQRRRLTPRTRSNREVICNAHIYVPRPYACNSWRLRDTRWQNAALSAVLTQTGFSGAQSCMGPTGPHKGSAAHAFFYRMCDS